MRRRARAISRAGLAVALLGLCMAAGASAAYTGDPITLPLEERRLIEVFRIFVEQSGLSIAADESVLQRIVRFGAENEEWDRALDRVMSAEGLSWQLSGGTLLIEPRESSLPIATGNCLDRLGADPARPDCVVVRVDVGALDPGELARRGLATDASALRHAPCVPFTSISADDEGMAPCCDASLELAVDPETTREAWILRPGIRSREDLLKIRVVRGDSPWPADLNVSVTRGSSSLCGAGLIGGSAKPILLGAATDEAEAVFVQVSAELPRP